MLKPALGLDLGQKTLGIAKSDSLGFVFGVETYRFKNYDYESASNYVIDFLSKNNIEVVVIGYPLTLKGELSEMSKNVLSFKELLLNKNPNLTIELVDERLTSVEANRTLSFLNVNHNTRKANVDTLAAQEILETYIRKEKNK